MGDLPPNYNKSPGFFELALENASVMMWTTNQKKECVYFSNAWLKFRGRTLAQEAGYGWAEGVHPEDYDRCLETFVTAFDRREPFSMTYRLMRADGVYRWIRDDGQPFLDKDQNFQGYIGSCYDVTSEKEMHTALKIKERDHRDLLKNIHAGVVVHAANSKILFANEQASKILGVSKELLLGTPTNHPQWIFYHEDDSIMAVEDYPASIVLAEKKVLRDYIVGIYRPLLNDRVWVLVNGYPEFDDQGELIQVVMTFVDITALKTAQLKLQESQQRINLAQKSAGLGIWDWNIKNNTFAWDEQMMCLYGIDKMRHPISLELWERMIHEEDRPRILKELNDALAHKNELKMSFRIIILGGFERHIDGHGMIIRDDEGKPIRMLGVNFDTTERNQLEEQIRHMGKMDAIGQLAGGIAHDFNNQLTVILATAEILLGRFEEEEQKKYIRNISNAARRSSTLTTNLLAFSRKGQYQNIGLDMHSLVKDLLSLLEPSIDKRIELRIDLQAKNSVVKGDPSLLQNALLNIAINARDAMPNGGMLSIITENVAYNDSIIPVSDMSMPEGRCFCVTIKDSGTGIPNHILPHIFEPFYTTKEPGAGTGMGLASVYGTIKQHNGVIAVTTKPGSGTIFTIYLPLAEEVNEYRDITPAQPLPITNKKLHILFVDDEILLRDLAKEFLTSEGHSVEFCEDGAQAVELYMRKWQEIDLVILDMMMPIMDGKEALLMMKKINPKITVILSSGYSIAEKSGTVQTDLGVDFLQKPYTKRELINVINRVSMCS